MALFSVLVDFQHFYIYLWHLFFCNALQCTFSFLIRKLIIPSTSNKQKQVYLSFLLGSLRKFKYYSLFIELHLKKFFLKKQLGKEVSEAFSNLKKSTFK